jgi:hypothetical protein
MQAASFMGSWWIFRVFEWILAKFADLTIPFSYFPFSYFSLFLRNN